MVLYYYLKYTDDVVMDALIEIEVYWYANAWRFDDRLSRLSKQRIFTGFQRVLGDLVKDVYNANNGFRLLLSDSHFPGHQRCLILEGESVNGWLYKTDDNTEEGQLSPLLLRYFSEPPETIYLMAEPITKGTPEEAKELELRIKELETIVNDLKLEIRYLKGDAEIPRQIP